MLLKVRNSVSTFLHDQIHLLRLRRSGLSSNLSSLVSLEKDDISSKGTLFAEWDKGKDCTKWWSYFPVYDRHLSSYTNNPVKMLEIGIFKGGTIPAWKKILHQGSLYVGIDINPECEAFADEHQGTYIRIGSQSDKVFLAEVISEFGPFDIIIDDGSHRPEDQIASFNILFEKGLAANGIYFVEDTHAESYRRFGQGQKSFVKLVTSVSRAMNFVYSENRPLNRFRKGCKDRYKFLRVPKVISCIEFIEFSDSMIVVKKASSKGIPMSDWR